MSSIKIEVVERVNFPLVRNSLGTFLQVGNLPYWDMPVLLPMNADVDEVHGRGDEAYNVTDNYPVTEAGHVPVLLVFAE